MSANPPILAVPPQAPSPTAYINRYLTSVRPHFTEHANVGVATFEREIREGLPPNLSSDVAESKGAAEVDGKGRNRGSSEERGSDRVMTRGEIMARLDGELYSGVQARPQARHLGRHAPEMESTETRFPFKAPISSPSSSPYRQSPLQPSRTKPSPSLPLEEHSRHVTSKLPPNISSTLHNLCEDAGVSGEGKEKKGGVEEVETESAQRRLERKLRRREKAAIVKPKPKPSSPLPARPKARGSRKHSAPSIDGTLEGSESGGEDRACRRRKKVSRKRAIPEFMKSYQAKNVFPAEGRITARPVRKQGFLCHGKASIPIMLPSEKARLAPPQPFSEKLFLGTHEVGRPSSDDDENIHWGLRRPSGSQAVEPQHHHQQRSKSRAPTLPLPRTIATSHLSTSFRSSTSDRRHASFSRLPPPGLTASPSWHTETSQREKEWERRSHTGMGAGSLRHVESDRMEGSLRARSLRMGSPVESCWRGVGVKEEREESRRVGGQAGRKLDEMLAEDKWRWSKHHSSTPFRQFQPIPFVRAEKVEAEAWSETLVRPPSLPPATGHRQSQPLPASYTGPDSTSHPVVRLPPCRGETPSFGTRHLTPTYTEDQPLWMPPHEEGEGRHEGEYVQEGYEEVYCGEESSEKAYGSNLEAEYSQWLTTVDARGHYPSQVSHLDYQPVHEQQQAHRQPHPMPFHPSSIRPCTPARPQMVQPSVNHTFDPDICLPHAPAARFGYPAASTNAAYVKDIGYVSASGCSYVPYDHPSGMSAEPGMSIPGEAQGKEARRDNEVERFEATEAEWQKLWAERNWMR